MRMPGVSTQEGGEDQAELQSWVNRRIEKFVSAHGSTMIGWSNFAGPASPQKRGDGLDAARDGSREGRGTTW